MWKHGLKSNLSCVTVLTIVCILSSGAALGLGIWCLLPDTPWYRYVVWFTATTTETRNSVFSSYGRNVGVWILYRNLLIILIVGVCAQGISFISLLITSIGRFMRNREGDICGFTLYTKLLMLLSSFGGMVCFNLACVYFAADHVDSAHACDYAVSADLPWCRHFVWADTLGNIAQPYSGWIGVTAASGCSILAFLLGWFVRSRAGHWFSGDDDEGAVYSSKRSYTRINSARR